MVSKCKEEAEDENWHQSIVVEIAFILDRHFIYGIKSLLELFLCAVPLTCRSNPEEVFISSPALICDIIDL